MKKTLLFLLLAFLAPFVLLQATIHEVEVTNFSYIPSELTIEDGDTVRYLWIEGNHPTVSGVDGENDEVFMSFPMNSGSTVFDLVLPGPGTYPYFCAFHFQDGMVGSITVNADPSQEGPCGDLFFSEYVEGSSFNKALEIYNPTESAVDLSDYIVRRFNNGSLEVSFSDTLQGMLAPGDTYLIADPDAGDFLIAASDMTSDITSVNGDDAIELLNRTVVIDVIGEVGVDPGEEWEVGSGSTENNTLVRKSFVQQGQLDWSIGANEWDVFAIDDFTHVGSHNMIPCEGEVVPFASISPASAEVGEEDGEYTFSVILSNGNDDPTEIAIEGTDGTAFNGIDYDFEPSTFALDASNTEMEFTVTLINDEEMEPDETIEISIMVLSNGSVGTETITITIDDDDTPITEFSIGDATVVDGEGFPVNNETEAIIRGITHGVNLSTNGLQFALIDETGGLQVFSFDQIDGYVFTEGDELEINGIIGQFNGQTQLSPLSITVLSSGNDLFSPGIVSALDESTESEHITLECVEITDSGSWDGEGTGDNVTISNGTDDFLMRIDDQTDIFGSDVPTGVFNLTGIGGQFDNSEPYLEGYQIFPMYSSAFDFSVGPQAEITAEMILSDFEYSFSATDGLDSYEWNFGDGESGSGQTVEHTFQNPGTYMVTVNFTGEGECSNSGTASYEVIVGPTGIDDQIDFAVQLIPNPAQDFTLVKSELPIERISVVSVTGQEIFKATDINNNEYQLSLRAIHEGIYLILIENESGKSIQKLVRN